jgi:microcystin-dependent protein
MTTPFIGQITAFPYSFAPAGWIECAGQILPIQQYAALFSLLGTQFGGNGTSNFGLPDLQGRVPVSFGQATGMSLYNMGEKGGSEAVQIQPNTMPAHTHALSATTVHGDTNNPAGKVLAAPIQGGIGHQIKGLIYNTSAPETTLAVQAIAPAGGNLPQNNPHNNVQPFVVLRYCIALRGAFPPRS